MVASADAVEAEALQIPIGAPVASMQPLFCDAQGRILYYGHFVYRGDRFGDERDLTNYILDHW